MYKVSKLIGQWEVDENFIKTFGNGLKFDLSIWEVGVNLIKTFWKWV